MNAPFLLIFISNKSFWGSIISKAADECSMMDRRVKNLTVESVTIGQVWYSYPSTILFLYYCLMLNFKWNVNASEEAFTSDKVVLCCSLW